ncbi:MAG: TlpA disulfide reductase family protein [Eubacteriales bacterium]|nr:TlpA disulfide reductase family protein [Eubacteriales bacterium]
MKRKIVTLILAATMLLSLAACSAPGNTGGSQSGADAPAEGEMMAASVGSPVNMEPAVENTFPYLGVTIRYPEALRNAVLDNLVFMTPFEDVEYTDLKDSAVIPMDWRPTPEHTLLHSGGIEFLYVPQQMQSQTPHAGMKDLMSYDEFQVWVKDTHPMARLGMYRKADFREELLRETGYAEHELLTESGEYLFYLSSNPVSDDASQEEKDLFAALDGLKEGLVIFDPRPVDDSYFGITTPEVIEISHVGDFSTETLEGETIDQGIFSNKKLTMINAWTTWCGACIEEMPDLEALSKELENSDAQVISIVCDTYDARDGVNEELLELAQRIQERTGVTFPTLIPDDSLKDGLLQGILGYPTTWFVDEKGTVIGEPVLGSHSKDEWMALIEERMAEAAK